MSDAAELKGQVKQLQNATNDEEIIGLLSVFKNTLKVTEPLLRESKAGLAVGKLRTHASKEVSDLAKEIVKKWKVEVERAKLGGTVKMENGRPTPMRKASIVTASTAPSTPISPTLRLDLRSAKGDGVKLDNTGDKTRDKCMELIYDALASDSNAPNDQILQRAQAVENTILTEFGITNASYKSKIRSLVVNLKDAKNPALRESIVTGDLPVSKFCKMSNEELASEERKAADNKIKEDNFFRSLGAGDQQSETTAFTCGRCKQNKTRYRQAQTRSADEPMTTFVTCTNCGNRWKFS